MAYGFNDDKSKAYFSGEKRTFNFSDYNSIAALVVDLGKYVYNHNYRLVGMTTGNGKTHAANLAYSMPNAYTDIALNLTSEYEYKHEIVIKLNIYGSLEDATTPSSETATAIERVTKWVTGTTDQNITGYKQTITISDLSGYKIEATRY